MIEVINKKVIVLNDFISLTDLTNNIFTRNLVTVVSESSIELNDGVFIEGEQYIKDGYIYNGKLSHHHLMLAQYEFEESNKSDMPRFYINGQRLWDGNMPFGAFLYSEKNPFVIKLTKGIVNEMKIKYIISKVTELNLMSTDFNFNYDCIPL